jgi:UDP-2-acetamido-3-amino-2,3-dideoxy-glucuronate N-acetyltransferase
MPIQRNVRVAVIGCGGWGRNLVRNFAELGALAAIVDADAATARALAEKYGCPVRDFAAVLADPAIDAVVIAAPAVHHYALAKQALLAGKHSFVEKPLALDLAQAQELCALAEQRDLRLMVGHLLQYHPVFLELKRLVKDGKLGRLQYLYSNRLNLGKIRREEDIMWSFAPHDISMILSLVGAEPVAVAAKGSYHLHKSIADVTTMHMSFPAGENAHVFVSWLHPFKEQKLVLVGSDAMAVFDDGEDWDSKLLLYPHRVDWKDQIPLAAKAEATAVPVLQAEPLRQECQHFLDCVANGASPRTDGREGVRVLSVLAQATQALRAAAPASATADTASKPRVTGSFPGVTIHETAYVDGGVSIGPKTRIWHFSHLLANTRVGSGCSIGQNVVIGPNVTVGDHVKIQNNVSIYDGVTLEDGVFCGPSCVFTNVDNPRAEIERKSEFLATLVRRGASIGANATIVCGHTLGQYCFIAAGAVVASDVPDHALMAGVPARRIGWMSKAGGRLGPDLICPIDASCYRLSGDGRLEAQGALPE